MRLTFVLVLLISFLVKSIVCRDYPAELELLQVQAAFRHGARTPLTKFPHDDAGTTWNCPFTDFEVPNILKTPTSVDLSPRLFLDGRNWLKGTCFAGQLTENGCLMHVDLGKSFRNTYISEQKFIPDTLNTSLLFVRSTNVFRARQSVECQMLGLYPEDKRTTGYDLFSVDPKREMLYPNTDYCPKLGYLGAERQKKVDAYEKSLVSLHEELTQIFATEYLPSINGLYDGVMARIAENISLPVGMTEEVVQEIIDAASHGAYLGFDTSSLRLAIGLLVGDIVDYMNNSPRKWVLWSGHDSTLIPLLSALGVSDGVWPHFASNMVFELFRNKSDGGRVVRGIYNDKDVVFPTCTDSFCSFDDFMKTAEPLIPTDYGKECEYTAPPDSCPSCDNCNDKVSRDTFVGVVVSLSVVLLVACVGLVFAFRKRRAYNPIM